MFTFHVPGSGGARNDLPVLASKPLPDGTVLTAIGFGHNYVVLLHQIVRELQVQLPTVSDPFQDRFWNRDRTHGTVEMETITTRVVTRDKFEEMRDRYEDFVREEPEQIAAAALQITDQR